MEQCELFPGVNFAEDSQDGAGDEYKFLPESDEESLANWLNSSAGDDKFVPETEPQDLVPMESSGKSMKVVDVHAIKEEYGTREVDSDAEIEDESIPSQGKNKSK